MTQETIEKALGPVMTAIRNLGTGDTVRVQTGGPMGGVTITVETNHLESLVHAAAHALYAEALALAERVEKAGPDEIDDIVADLRNTVSA